MKQLIQQFIDDGMEGVVALMALSFIIGFALCAVIARHSGCVSG
jgi:hypothetical protein